MITQIKRADGTYMSGIKSCTFSEIVNAEHNLMPGCVASAHIEVEVYGSASAAPAVGEALTYYQVQGDNEPVQIGIFYAEPFISGQNTFRFSAYDAALKLDADFSTRLAELQSSFPMTSTALLGEVSTFSGVPITPPTSFTVNAFYADGITCRQIVSWCAQMVGAFARCDASGTLKFASYGLAQFVIYPGGPHESSSGRSYIAYKQDGAEFANYEIAADDYAVVAHSAIDESVSYMYPIDYTGDNIIHVRDNLLVTTAQQCMSWAIATYDFIGGIFFTYRWRPATIRLFPDENPLRAGNVVFVEAANGEGEATIFEVPIMSMTVNETETVLSATSEETYTEQTTSSFKDTQTALSANILLLKEGMQSQQEQIDAVSAWQNWSHRNLLDNWYWVYGRSLANGASDYTSVGTFPINQRGRYGYSPIPGGGSGVAGIDRWRASYGSGLTLAFHTDATSHVGDGITLTNTTSSTKRWLMNIAPQPYPAGKYTASILISDYSGSISFGTRYSSTNNVMEINSTGLLSHMITLGENGGDRFIILLDGGASVTVQAVKLEMGDTQTLAHLEDGVWVINEVPNYAEELQKCQRYFQIFRSQALRPTYGADFRPTMATDAPSTTDEWTIGSTDYYLASSEP